MLGTRPPGRGVPSLSAKVYFKETYHFLRQYILSSTFNVMRESCK